MKKIIFLLTLLISSQAYAQKYFTKTGSIGFSASGPLEKIEGNNKSLLAVLDSKTGSIDCIVTIKNFIFKQQLMQEHFNENYMESDKFPKATFKGKIVGIESINFKKDGEYPTKVAGTLHIHGQNKEVSTVGTIIIKNGNPTMKSNFTIILSDYGISIPGAVKDKISKEAKISLLAPLELKK